MSGLLWRGDPVDCQYCKNGRFPHDHAHDKMIVRHHSRKSTVRYSKAPPRIIQQTLEFGDTVEPTE